MSKMNTAKTVEEIAKPVVESLNLELVDVEFVKEAGNWFLRIYIDKEGGVTIDDCEDVSRAMSPVLDEKDPIEQAYYLEVSSPGLDRPLKKESDFERYKGELVEVKLYKALEGQKAFEGELVGLIDNKIVIKYESEKEMAFAKDDVSIVKLVVQF